MSSAYSQHDRSRRARRLSRRHPLRIRQDAAHAGLRGARRCCFRSCSTCCSACSWAARAATRGMSLFAFAAYGVFGAMAPGLFGFGVSLAFEREQGLLTFKQALPMPPGSYLLARMVMAMMFVAIISLCHDHAGVVRRARAADLRPGSQACSSSTCSACCRSARSALFVGSLVSGQAAPAIVNLIYLPMAFLSGLWVPLQFLPKFIAATRAALARVPSGRSCRSTAVDAPSTVGSTANHIAALVGVTVLFFALAVRRLGGRGIRLFGAPRAGFGFPLRRAINVRRVLDCRRPGHRRCHGRQCAADRRQNRGHVE